MLNKSKIQNRSLALIVGILLAFTLLMSRILSRLPGYDFELGLMNGLTIVLSIYYVILHIRIKRVKKDI